MTRLVADAISWAQMEWVLLLLKVSRDISKTYSRWHHP